MTRTRHLELEPELSQFIWLYGKALAASRAAKKANRRREAQVILTFDEHGRMSVRYRPEESPADEPEPDGALSVVSPGPEK